MKKNKKQNQESSTETGVLAEPAPLPAAALHDIALTAIRVAPGQPRKHFDEAKLAELAENIKQVGVLSPLIVRPLPKYELQPPDLADPDWRLLADGVVTQRELDQHFPRELIQRKFKELSKEGGEFELVAGERRWRAAGLARLASVPALVRQLSDLQVLEIQGIENLQREGLSAIEEADWMKRLIESGAHSKESLAEKLGIKRSTVYSRLRLTNVSQPVRTALVFGRLPGSIGDIIATIPSEKNQEKALKEILHGGEMFKDPADDEYKRTCMSARAAKELVEREYRIGLSTAKFDKKDAELPGGPCAECPKRTGNLDPATDSPNVCTDPACFQAKTAAALAAQKAKLTEKGLTVLTPQETKGLFARWDPNVLQEDGRFLKPDTELAVGKKKVLVSELAKDVAAVVAIDGEHKAHRLYRVADLAPMLKEKGIELNLSGRRGQQSAEDRAKEQAKREADEKVSEEVAARALPLARAKLDGMAADAKFWRFVLDEDYGAKQVLKARGLNLAQAKPGELLAVFFEDRYLEEYSNYDGGMGKQFAEALKFLGVNLDKIRETVIEEQRAAKEGEPAKAGVPKGKKKGKK